MYINYMFVDEYLLLYNRYGTPYLLSLDLSKELTALVWLAGPLSGLLVQPVSNLFCSFRLFHRK